MASDTRASFDRRQVLRLCGAALIASPSAPRAQGRSEVELMADKLLDAIGGRAAWGRISNLLTDSQHHGSGEPGVVRTVTAVDFRAARSRIETTANGLLMVRVFDGDRSWRLLRDGTVEAMPAGALADERRWYAAHPYRTLQRVASRDPILSVQKGRDGRLEVHEGGKRLAWYAMDQRGAPFAFGAHDDEAGTICGPWEHERRGIVLPVWTSSPDGRARSLLKSLDVNIELGSAFFERPAKR